MRTAMEVCLMELAEWEGENDSPVGAFAHVVVDSDSRLTPCEDLDANDWLQSTEGVQHFVIQWAFDGSTYVERCENERYAIRAITDLRNAYQVYVDNINMF